MSLFSFILYFSPMFSSGHEIMNINFTPYIYLHVSLLIITPMSPLPDQDVVSHHFLIYLIIVADSVIHLIYKPFIFSTRYTLQWRLTFIVYLWYSELENETNMINHSRYCTDVKINNMLDCFSSEISILNINCRSFNEHFDKLKLYMF